ASCPHRAGSCRAREKYPARGWERHWRPGAGTGTELSVEYPYHASRSLRWHSMRRLPNFISGCRLATAPVLLLLAWYCYARAFLAVTTVSFASDVLDGYLARRLGQTSELGARLDSVGGFVIYCTLPLGAWWLWPAMVRRELPWFLTVLASCVLPPLVARW